MMTKCIKYIVVCCIMLGVQSSYAQFEPSLTQYLFNELNINPAYAGSRETFSLTALNREQWSGINGAPNTSMVSLHTPIYNKRGGLGMAYLVESIGVSRRSSFNMNAAYRMAFKERSLSFGLQFSMVTISENYQDLGLVDDAVFLTNTGRMKAKNMGFGMYYTTQKYYLGLSIPRLLYNKVSVATGSSMVETAMQMNQWHYYIAAGKMKKWSPSFVWRTNAMIKVASGAPVQLDLNVNGFIRDKVWIGGGLRTGDAILFNAGVQFGPHFRVGYAHDFTISGLRSYSGGTNEIALGIDIGMKNDKLVSPRYF
jgi:type IX secretion system PorP/SprF family membrane protein